MVIHGHHEVLRQMSGESKEVPRVALFRGPTSVGKWATAESLRGRWGVASSDVLRVHLLTMDAARGLVSFAGMSPIDPSSGRLAIVQLDKATPSALNVLLKVLEDSRPEVRFILISENQPPETIVSRAFVYVFARLTTAEVEAILTARRFSPAEAHRLAVLSGGQVDRALKTLDTDDTKMLVLIALRAFRERDSSLLDGLSQRWTDEATALLSTWCVETITKRWLRFSEEESEIEGKNLPLKILMALRADVRPRLVIRSSLMAVMKGT